MKKIASSKVKDKRLLVSGSFMQENWIFEWEFTVK